MPAEARTSRSDAWLAPTEPGPPGSAPDRSDPLTQHHPGRRIPTGHPFEQLDEASRQPMEPNRPQPVQCPLDRVMFDHTLHANHTKVALLQLGVQLVFRVELVIDRVSTNVPRIADGAVLRIDDQGPAAPEDAMQFRVQAPPVVAPEVPNET